MYIVHSYNDTPKGKTKRLSMVIGNTGNPCTDHPFARGTLHITIVWMVQGDHTYCHKQSGELLEGPDYCCMSVPYVNLLIPVQARPKYLHTHIYNMYII